MFVPKPILPSTPPMVSYLPVISPVLKEFSINVPLDKYPAAFVAPTRPPTLE